MSVDEKYGRTPKSLIERKTVSFTELYNANKISDGMKFTMEYDSVTYYARAVVTADEKIVICRFWMKISSHISVPVILLSGYMKVLLRVFMLSTFTGKSMV